MADGEIVVPDYDDSAQDAGALSLDDLASMQAKPAGGLADKIPLSRKHALGLYVVCLCVCCRSRSLRGGARHVQCCRLG